MSNNRYIKDRTRKRTAETMERKVKALQDKLNERKKDNGSK